MFLFKDGLFGIIKSVIVVDVETTGLDPGTCSIVSLGAVDFLKPENQFYQECRIWEGAQVVEKALEINGFSRKEVIDPGKKSLKKVMEEFLAWMDEIENRTIAGENPSFDRDFLKASAQRCGVGWLISHRTIDLHSLAYESYLKRGLDLPVKNERIDLNADRIFNYVGLPTEPKPHRALVGAKMEAEAFSRLIYGKLLLKDFESLPVPDYLKVKIIERRKMSEGLGISRRKKSE